MQKNTTPIYIDYIENNINLIDKGDWGTFFDDAPAGIGSFLYDADIDFLSELTYIPSEAFWNSPLSSIDIPNNVRQINKFAFSKANLQEINIPDTITMIQESAFTDCTSLKTIRLSHALQSIEQKVFWGCVSLSALTIPSNVTIIKTRAFQDCTALGKVFLPESIQTLESDCFAYCNTLEIFYLGTKDQWRHINKKDAFRYTNVLIHCADGILSKT